MVVQLTSEGNLRSRSLKASPTGLKDSTMCRLRRTCGQEEGQSMEDGGQHGYGMAEGL